jgi:hypothetical protein
MSVTSWTISVIEADDNLSLGRIPCSSTLLDPGYGGSAYGANRPGRVRARDQAFYENDTAVT